MRSSFFQHTPRRLQRLSVPERHTVLGSSLREAERAVERVHGPQSEPVDLTYADTKRFPPPEWVAERYLQAAAGQGRTYTPYRGDAGVRAAVADNLSHYLGLPVDPDQGLILTPGTQAALYLALSSLVDEGDQVLVLDPDYLTTERILRYLGAQVVPVPLRWDTGQPTPDLDFLEQALAQNPRLLVFSNPNNPTGALLDPAVLDAIATLVARTPNTGVLVDQLYARLVYDGLDYDHLIRRPEIRERCVTLLGPSKTESMSGYRVGVAVAPAELVERMEDLLGVTALRAPAYAQHTLVPWLRDDAGFVQQRVKEYQRLRDLTVERLNASPAFEVTPAQGTAYLFPRLVGVELPDQELFIRLQHEAGVVINPGYQFGLRGARHLRICFAQDEQTWPEVLDRVVTSVEGMR